MNESLVEEWRPYFDTVYDVSNTGYVRNREKSLVLKPTITRQGYQRLTIWHDRKARTSAVHRMVAEVFLENTDCKAVVNHKDGNQGNNRLENLEWTTISENIKHAYATGLAAVGEDSVVAKLSEAEVIEILDDLRAGLAVIRVAEKFKISATAVSHIWHGRTWKHLKREKPTAKDYKGKLSASDISVIRKLFEEGYSDSNIASKYGVVNASIGSIRRGKNWKNY